MHLPTYSDDEGEDDDFIAEKILMDKPDPRTPETIFSAIQLGVAVLERCMVML